jgi:thioredoxin-related protein
MKNKSKYIYLALLVVFCLWLWPQNNAFSAASIKWFSYDEGMKLGKSENKKIFLHFYTDWCPYCKKMAKETFTDTAVASYLNTHFIPIRVNSDIQRKIAAMYNVRGIPVTWFLTENGERIGALPGFISQDRLLKILGKVKQPDQKDGGSP